MNKKIMIDPGHAPGNVNAGKNGYKEYAGMWKLSNYLKTALERCGCTVLLTRSEDEDPTLSKRGQKAKCYDLFISEHSNAANGTARGVEVYYSVGIPQDKGFAAALSKAVSLLMNNPDRGAKTNENEKAPGKDYYAVMQSARDTGVPHVLLVESGFHDNIQDEAFLLKDDNLRAIAEAQAKVICTYLGCAYKDVAPAFTGTRIMGTAVATAAQMAAYLISKNPTTEPYAMAYALMYIAEGIAEGVRGDIAFAQACLETGFLKFGNDVKAYQYNFAGMGATGGGVPGLSFASPQDGIRAHVQHLKAYGSAELLRGDLVKPLNGEKPRYDYVIPKGCSEFVEWLGMCENPLNEGRPRNEWKGWASDLGYGGKILSVLKGILDTKVEGRIPEEIIVDYWIANGIVTDRIYWLGVLMGTIKPDPEYLRIVFERLYNINVQLNEENAKLHEEIAMLKQEYKLTQ